MRFLLVNSIPHYLEIARSRGDLLATHTVVTADLGVAMLLEDEGRNFKELWDYLSDDELESHWEEAWKVSRGWHGIAATDLECFGAHPLLCSELEMVLPCETAINAAVAFDRFIKTERPSELVGAGQAVPIYRNGPPPVYQGTAAIAEAVARWQCDRHQVNFWVCDARPPELERVRPPSMFRQRIPTASHASMPPPASSDRPLLMLLDLLQNSRDLFALESELTRQGNFRVLRVSELRRSYYPIVPPLPESVEASLKKCAALSADARQRYRGGHPYIFANRHLEFQFNGVWEEIRRSCEAAAFMKPIFSLLRPDALLLGADCFTCEGFIRDIARNQGIAVGILLHSGLSITRGWRELCSPADRTFTWGEPDTQALTSVGADSKKMAAVGSLRYLDLASAAGHPLSSKRQDKTLKKRFGFAPEARVISLLTGPANLGLAMSLAHPRKHRDILRDIVRWARERPDVIILLKPHPGYDHLDCYRYLSKTFPANMRFAEGATLRDVLSISDAAFLLNQCTTAALEAMPEIPVAFVRHGYRATPALRTSLDGDVVFHATDLAELAAWNDRLSSDASLRERFLSRQRAFVIRASCDPSGKHPATRITEELEHVLAAKAKTQRNGRDLESSESDVFAGLWHEDVSAVVPLWGALFSSLTLEERPGFLLATAIVLSTVVSDPKRLRPLLSRFGEETARRAGHGDAQTFALSIGLSAMIRSLNRHRWPDVVRFAVQTFRCAPRVAARSQLLWRLVARALVMDGATDLRSLRHFTRSTAPARWKAQTRQPVRPSPPRHEKRRL
jgi:hypothetical protein